MTGGPDVTGEPDGTVLSLDRLSLSFGGLKAISGLDLQVGEREVHGGSSTIEEDDHRSESGTGGPVKGTGTDLAS